MTIANNFKVVVASDEFGQLCSDQLAVILKSDELVVRGEDEVLNALMSWMAFDKANRAAEFLALFKLIRFPFLGKSVRQKNDFLWKSYDEDFLQAVIDVLEHFHEVEDHQRTVISTIAHRSKQSRVYVRPRAYLDITIFAIGGMSKSGLSIEKYRRDQNEWKTMKELPGKQMRSASVFLGNEIIVTGGRDNGVLKLVCSFDFNHNELALNECFFAGHCNRCQYT